MPLILTGDVSDGTPLAGDMVFGQFYRIATFALNGKLDDVNLAEIPNRAVRHPYLQHQATCGAGMTAGTCSLDYFTPQTKFDSDNIDENAIQGVYAGVGNPANGKDNDYIAIPGGSLQFHLPYRAYVLLTWQVTWTNDSDGIDRTSVVRLFVDDKSVGGNDGCNMRRVRRTCFAADKDDATNQRNKEYLRDRYKSRYWSGHQWLPLTGEEPLQKGFHSVSLRVLQSPLVPQTRVRARSLKYIFFKAQD